MDGRAHGSAQSRGDPDHPTADSSHSPDLRNATDRKFSSSTLYRLALVATVLGAAHHVDHVVRGNHVGWPVVPELTPFTYSLAVYPLVAAGLYLTATDRVGAGYWAGVFAVSGLGVGLAHLGPWAIEPPTHVIAPHGSPVVGYVAFALVLALLGCLVVGTVHAAWRRWWWRP